MIQKSLNFKKIKYVFATPDDFSEDKKYPLIILLHGAGGRGDNLSVIHENPYFYYLPKHELDVVSVAPLCYKDSWFDFFEQLQEFIEYAIGLPFIDKERCYMMGASMGGYGTWQMAMSRPELFAAIVPICGGGMYWNAHRLKNMGVWAFHGENDDVVFPEESKKMVDAVNKAGGNAKFSLCEGVDHGVWNNAYSSKEVFDWLLSHKLNNDNNFENKYNDQKKFG